MTVYEKIRFVPTDVFEQINVLPEQEKNISSSDKICFALKQKNNMGLYIYLNEKKIGFILINQFLSDSFFLWDFIIDGKFQNKGYGKVSLIKLCKHLKMNFSGNVVTTTYIAGNHRAKKLYEDIGFQETGMVEVNGIYEVNLHLNLQELNEMFI